ncbi:hypothetical protein EDB85DRAFT_1892395 [Lactarius pseudohatsudake]|nr:hypothetical protein EDB85DRAFT_1892395 [Lactarius pseudohatsudake]
MRGNGKCRDGNAGMGRNAGDGNAGMGNVGMGRNIWDGEEYGDGGYGKEDHRMGEGNIVGGGIWGWGEGRGGGYGKGGYWARRTMNERGQQNMGEGDMGMGWGMG